MKNYFANNLKILRKSKKISQKEMAKILNIGQTMISTYEKNLSIPNLELLEKISDYFEISIGELIEKPIDMDLQLNLEEIEYLHLVLSNYEVETQGFLIKDGAFCDNLLDAGTVFYRDYKNNRHKYYQKIQFKIIAGNKNKNIEIGYISGYYMNLKKIYAADKVDVKKEFSLNELLSIFFSKVLFENKNIYNNYINDIFYLNNLYIDNRYYNMADNIDMVCLKEIMRAFNNIFNIKIQKLFYSFGTIEKEHINFLKKSSYYNQKKQLDILGFKLIATENIVVDDDSILTIFDENISIYDL